jgi:hypothetical protein
MEKPSEENVVMRNVALFVLGASVACSAGPDTNAEPNADHGAGRTTEALAPAWTGTWSVSPQGASGAFNQQTLRQIVRTSVAGSAARIQISNLYGSQPLHISNVHIALRSSGSSITASTDRTVTFAGSGSLTVAAGALAVSDSVAFSVPALSDVAVSFYLPQASGTATVHSVGKQTNYIASGNATARDSS